MERLFQFDRSVTLAALVVPIIRRRPIIHKIDSTRAGLFSDVNDKESSWGICKLFFVH